MNILPITSADTFIKTTIKVDTESDGSKTWKLNLPFPVTGQIIYQNGQDITYRDNSDKNGQTVVAWICYDVEQHGQAVKKYAGLIGENPIQSVDYKTAYPITKAEALATEVDGVKVPYNGADKTESVLFCQRLYPNKSLIVEAVVDGEAIKT